MGYSAKGTLRAGDCQLATGLTIMVTTKIVSRFQGPPNPSGDNRSIPYGPLYPADEVLRLLEGKGHDAIHLWTRKGIADQQKYGHDSETILELLELALTRGCFLGSQWCQQRENGPWAACDAYSFWRDEWMPVAHKSLSVEYYLKFALNKTGIVLLVVSCHPYENRY